MTNVKSTKKALIASILSLCMCFSMLLGTTFAWFTDSVTSANNVITAGNLDVELYWTTTPKDDDSWKPVTATSSVFDTTLWEPGKTQVVYLKVKNEGTLALQYKLGVNVAGEVPSTNKYGEEFKLSSFIEYGVVDGATEYDDRTDAIAAVSSVATKLNVAYNSGAIDLAAGAEKFVTMVVYMPTTVGNEANYDKDAKIATIKLGLNVFATQTTFEEDSFGKDYDTGIEFPIVTTAEELIAALQNGQSVKLDKDITLEDGQSIVIPASAVATYSMRAATPAIVIDLNGNTITGTMHKDAGAVIKNEGNLIIKNGTISSTANNGGSAIMNKGTLVVENVTLNGAPNADGSWPSYAVNNVGVMTITDSKITSFHGAVCSYAEGAIITMNNTDVEMAGIPGFTSHGIYTYNGGKVVVNGGNIANKATDQNSTGASVINGNVEIYGGTFTGRIENYYGTPVIYGGTFSVDPKAFIATGCESTGNGDGTYTVGMTNETLTDALGDAKAGDTIKVPVGTYTFPASSLKEGVTLNCAPGTVFEGNSKLNINGATVIGATFSNPTGIAADQTINGTFKDCTFTGQNGLRWCYAGETVVFENCVFDGSTYGVHFDGGANEVVFKDCTLSGFNAMGGAITKLTMEGCTFKANDRSGYNGINLWGNTDLVNCTFVFDGTKTEWVDLCGDNKTVTFTNCVVTDGTTETPIETVVGDYGAGNTIIVDGDYVAKTADALRTIAKNATGDVTVRLGADITLGDDTTQKEMGAYFLNATSVTIIGNGKKLTLKGKMPGNDWHDQFYAGIIAPNAEVTVKDVTIVNEKLDKNGNPYSADRESVYTMVRGTEVLFENVNFDGGVQVKNNTKFVNCSFKEDILVEENGYATNGMFCVFIDFQYKADAVCTVDFEGCTFDASGYGCVKVAGDEGANITVNVKDCSFTNTCPSNSWSKTTPKYDVKMTGSNITGKDLGGNKWSDGANAGFGNG